MISFDDVTKRNIKYHNLHWSLIPDHLDQILIIGGPGLGKTNSLYNLISHQPHIDKTYLYAKDPYEAKYQFLVYKREKIGLNHFNDFKAFIEYSNDMDDIYQNTEKYNPNKKRKILIVFDGMTADMLNNKKLNLIVTKLFIRGRKLNISLLFITQSYFAVLKNIRLNSKHSFIIKIPKKGIQRMAFNYSSNIDFRDFINLYKKCTAKPYSFLVFDTTVSSDNSLFFRKNLSERT